MIRYLRIRNFKAWRDSGRIRMAPLTVIFGANSAGKSSLGHLLLALKQTSASSDRRRALHTGDEASLIDLGTFVECLYGHKASAELEFTVDWSLPEVLRVKNPLDATQSYAGNCLQLQCALTANPAGQPVVRRIQYDLHDGDTDEQALTATFTQPPDGRILLRTSPYTLVRADGRKWPLDPPEKFYRLSDRSLARYKNADFLADFALAVERGFAGVSHLGPLRDPPRRTYGWSGNTPEGVGPRGEYAIACVLAAQAAQRSLNRGYKKRTQPFAEFIASWLVDLGVIETFEVRPTAPGRKEYDVKVTTLGGLTEVGLPDVGFGISQVLPALVQAFYCEPGSIVWMEQPEIHLHPQVQAELADAFISAVQAYEGGRPRNVQIILESHSEHLLNRLQRRIAEGVLAAEDVAVYFARAGTRGAQLEELQLNEDGDISNWPDHFFGDEMGDLLARARAAAARRGRANR